MEYSHAFFLYIAAVKLFDALVVLGVWYASWFLRFHSALFAAPKGIPELDRYSDVALSLILVFVAVFHVVGAYRRDRIAFGFRPLKKIAQGAVLATLVFIAICYFLNEMHFSRVFLMLFPFLVIPAVGIERFFMHLFWLYAESHWVKPIRTLLVGTGELLSMHIQKIQARNPYPVEWVGRIGKLNEAEPLGRLPYWGDESVLGSRLDHRTVDRVVVSYPTSETEKYEGILQTLANQLVEVKVIPDFGKYSTFTYSAEEECGIPLLVFNRAPTGATDRALKRVVDIWGALFFLIFFSPLYFLIAALVKLTSRGPIFYSQLRMGADGRLFNIYKFRSMYTDAEANTGAVWATKDDARTTKLGSFLRRTSLDEIPQFWNVLKGDMSLVGPRPERPVFVDQFKKEIPKYMLRHKMKSGITGWAQINGWRGNTSIDERIKHDLYYIGHWSHLLDLKILVLTLLRGFVHRNAY